MCKPFTSMMVPPLSVTNPSRNTGVPPRARTLRLIDPAAMGMTSSGRPKAPSSMTNFDSSAMQMKVWARSLTIFSRVNAPPPPFIMCPA